ncbi:uncharacterized protein LOC123679104 [Harmonia axyridis]|uniref:uncharacterized protein LOC123679104 n=1 Tax=Harmonia axyridis TaxID=115357 RepID=UPI001E27630E|nr:uncharacterized protein LOC123679104 [Harmonia axyridis]
MAGMISFDEIDGYTVDVSPNERKYMCCICDSFILISPVHLNPSMGFICGFCWQYKHRFVKENDIILPQPLYEEFALSILFPCKYCEYYTFFDSPATKHEIQCANRIFECPLSKLNKWILPTMEYCNWQDTDGLSMVAHIKEKHEEFILRSPFEMSYQDIKNSEEERRLYIAILSNRSIIAISSEYDKEQNQLIFRCRSNKTGYAELNYQCRVEFSTSHSKVTDFVLVKVLPLGAKILETTEDYFSVWLDFLDDSSKFRFYFEPSLEPGQLNEFYLEDYYY